jgi:cell division initiation protein
MDITPQVINEVEFRQKVRGYDPDEVDDFLERMAVAVGQLQERVRDATDRAAAAERKTSELEEQLRGGGAEAAAPPAPSASAEADAQSAFSTLVLAQKTADAAIKEAKESSARMLADAQQESDRLRVEAESEARRAADATRRRLVDEIRALEQSKESLRCDVELLETHLADQRSRVRGSVEQLQRLIDDPDEFRVDAAPELASAGLPAFAVAFDEAVDDAEEAEDIGEPEPSGDDGDAVREFDDHPSSPTFAVSRDRERWDLDEAPSPTAVTADHGDAGVGDDDTGDSSEWDRFGPLADTAGPPTQPINLSDLERGDDAYMNELSKARLSDTGAAVEPGILFDQDEADGEPRARPRFGRRG